MVSFNMTETEIHNEDFALTLALRKGLKLIHTLPIFIIPVSHIQASTAKLDFDTSLETS